jgi:drug/metabolite transporter (DMT)-like permease
MDASVIFFFGPLPILALFLYIFRKRLTGWQRVGFVVIVYAISLLTGIFMASADDEAALIGGVVAPLAYCILYSIIVALQKPKVAPLPSQTAEVAPVGSPTAAPAQASQWNPMIVAAIIQAVASITIALINVLGK